ncbi:MAG: hypothetical protein BMS9Abin26_1918 [Gammaproteobacteria bacterium]|nr:MAG: hypothetical protein BMS9Abin26_1918 [Gammaproteobacteria bacterium]
MLKHFDSLIKRDPNLIFRFDQKAGVVRALRGKLASSKSKNKTNFCLKFLKTNAKLLGKINSRSLELVHNRQDKTGGQDLVFVQHHGKVPVINGRIRFHFDTQGILTTVSNSLSNDLGKVPRKAKISCDSAIKRAIKCTGGYGKLDSNPELVVYRFNDKPLLCWKLTIRETRHGKRIKPALWVVYLNASTGRELFHYNDLQTGNGDGVYSGSGAVVSSPSAATNILYDTTRVAGGGPDITTYDCAATNCAGALASSDADDNWNDTSTTPRSANQGAEVDLHRYAGEVIDYFDMEHGHNSFDNAGGSVLAHAHYNLEYNSGFWDTGLQRMYFGDGNNDPATTDGFDYTTSKDYVAHELTHGYIQNTCALEYHDEPGALNEALADSFAALITNNWLIFEEPWIQPTAPAARNMMDPTNGGLWNVATPEVFLLGHQPHHYDDRYISGVPPSPATDQNGVHINSGIINHLVYLLTVGGTHSSSGVTVTGLGITIVGQLLYRSMAINLLGNPLAEFIDFREQMLAACGELFPGDLNVLSQTKNAFNAVGIGPDNYVRDNLADTGEEPYGGAYLWASPDIINRTSLSANPAVEFADMTLDNLWENVEFGQDNYIYVRLQNRGNMNGDATINVYFSAATSFGDPASWIYIDTLPESGIVPGTTRIAGPITFPSALIPSPGHYCMIAVISDVLDPAPDHTLIASLTDYLDYVRNSNNIAYRNMDVVDDVMGMGGVGSFEVKGLRGQRDRFDLQIDTRQLIPGLRLLVRGPAKILNAANPHGLKLVKRTRKENIYEVIHGKKARHLERFLQPRAARRDRLPGFYNLLIDRKFKLHIHYEFANERVRKSLKKYQRSFEFRLQQQWQGENVGAVGLRFNLKKRKIR